MLTSAREPSASLWTATNNPGYSFSYFGITMGPLTSMSIKYIPILVVEAIFGDKLASWGSVSSHLTISLRYVYILRGVYCTRFPHHPSITLNFSNPSLFSLPQFLSPLPPPPPYLILPVKLPHLSCLSFVFPFSN